MNKKTCSTCDNYDGWACKIGGFIMGSSDAACKAYRAKRDADTGEPCCGTGEPDCGTSLPTGRNHELAERIRMMYRWTPYIPFYVILQQAMREMLPEGTNYCEALADLIDRPSIKPEKVGPVYWRCPRCGKINYKFVILGDCGPLPSHNCAYCGAVIADD